MSAKMIEMFSTIEASVQIGNAAMNANCVIVLSMMMITADTRDHVR